MMERNFRSAAEYIEQPLDCRRLSLQLCFFQLEKEQLWELARSVFQWLRDYVDHQFVFLCSGIDGDIPYDGICETMDAFLRKEKDFWMYIDGYRISPVVRNKTTLKKFQKKLKYYVHPVYTYGWNKDAYNGSGISSDYGPYFEKHFPMKRPDDEEIIDLIYKTFTEQGRVFRTWHTKADMDGQFRVQSHEGNEQRYRGTAYISFSAFSVENFLSDAAEDLVRFAERLAEAFVNVNAHVLLQPNNQILSAAICPYARYFGSYAVKEEDAGRYGYTNREWNHASYLHGIEWFTILSPLVCSHREGPFPDGIDNGVLIQHVGKSVTVRSLNTIGAFDYSDALKVKRALGTAIYPGGSHQPLRGMFPWENSTVRVYEWCPRFDWAVVPVEKQEIKIVGSNLIYDASERKA